MALPGTFDIISAFYWKWSGRAALCEGRWCICPCVVTRLFMERKSLRATPETRCVDTVFVPLSKSTAYCNIVEHHI